MSIKTPFLKHLIPLALVVLSIMLISGGNIAYAAADVYVWEGWNGSVIGNPPTGTPPAPGNAFTAPGALIFGTDAFATIQEAITAVDPGGNIWVYPGTYAENVLITKPVSLHGSYWNTPAFAVDPLTGRGGNETIIRPATNNAATGVLFRVNNAVNNVSIRGFIFDGDGDAGLGVGESLNGVDSNVAYGVRNIGATPGQNSTISNNIFRHINLSAIYWSGAAASISDSNTVSFNRVDNVGDAAINFLLNAHGDINHNNISRTVNGIQVASVTLPTASASTVASNEIQTSSIGIRLLNLDQGGTYSVATNLITPTTGSLTQSAIIISSIRNAVAVSTASNSIDGAHTGIQFINIPTSGTVSSTSDSIQNALNNGILLNNDASSDDGSHALIVTNATITNHVNAAIRLEESPITPIGSLNLTLTNANINGNDGPTTQGVQSTGQSIFVTINGSLIQNNNLGVNIGVSALATLNISNTQVNSSFTRGINFNGNPSGSAVNSSCIVGNNSGIRSASATLNAENNWWGAANGPAPVGSGDLIADPVANVDADPFTAVLPTVAGQLCLDSNIAPVIDNSGDPFLTTLPYDILPAANTGDSVADILASALPTVVFTDANGDPAGIAVIGVDNSNGTWAYSLNNGTNWTAFGAVAGNNAVLLHGNDPNTRIRFQPNAGFSGTVNPGITFRGWDRTDGNANGTTAVNINALGTGGSRPFSSSTETARITVDPPPNNAPVINNTGDPFLTNIQQDILPAVNAGDSVAAILTSAAPPTVFTDADGDPAGIAVIGVDNTNGAWEYSLNNGTSWTAFGAVSNTSAVLLHGNDTNTRIRFQPNAGFNGTVNPGITFRGWDRTDSNANGATSINVSTNGGTTAYSTATETARITVEIIPNSAPVINNTGDPFLTSILEDVLPAVNAGDSVADILASALPTIVFTDANSDPAGIAVIAVDNTNGAWEYSLNSGTSWTAFGAVSNTSAVLLHGDDSATLIRFQPAADFFGTVNPGITFRGWDRTDSNANGATGIDVSTNGGTTAYSTATETARITVTGVNDAPSFTASNPPTILEDAGAQTLVGWATFSPGPANESGQGVIGYTVSNISNAALFSAAPSVAANGTLTYTPAANAFGTSTFDVVVQDDGGTANGGVDTSTAQTFTITVTGVNDAPSFTIAGDPPDSLEDAGAQTVLNFATAISAGPPNEAAQTLTFILTITGTTGDLAFSSAPAINATNGTLTYTAAANTFGTATIDAVLQDNGGTANGGVDTSAAQTFTITVIGVNDAPSFTASNPPTILEDAGAQTLVGWATFSPGPANESGQSVIGYTVSNISNAALFSAAPSVAANGTLTYTPAANAFGTSTFDVVVQDDGGTANGGIDTSATQTFTITVTGVNDAPSFTIAGDPPDSLEDAGAQTVLNFATAISAGPPNESAQTLTFILTITGTTGDLTFSSAPAINATNGTLTYTAAANTFGTATIDAVLQDNGGTANGGVDTSAAQTFTITVIGVNDAPSFTASNPPTIPENAGPQTIVDWATFSPGPTNEASQTALGYTVSNISNAALFSTLPSVAPNGTLTYEAAADTFGTSTFDVVVQDDGGTANGGVDTSAAQTFTITVTNVNTAPSFTIAADPPDSLEDAGAQTVLNFATAISPGAPDEAGQVLTFILTITGTTGGLTFTSAPAIDATNGTLTYTATADSFGTATVDAVLMDDGGTANGGVDTSAPQTFVITVIGVNDAPSFTASNPPTIAEDAGAQTLVGWATFSPGPANESGQGVIGYTVSNISNAALFSAAPSVAANGTLTYTPAANAFGTSTFDVVVQDDGGTANGGVDTSATQTFTITVLSVNDAPSFVIAADPPTILEDAGAQTVLNFATSISAGPPNESAQTLTFILTITGTTGGLTFTSAPTIDATNGTLTYTAAANSFGTATVQAVLQDNGGTANGGVDTSAPQSFIITVTGVNDAPFFAIPADPPTVNEDAGPQTVLTFATNISAGPPNEAAQILTFNISPVSSTGNLAFTTDPAIAANGTLTYTTAPDTNGTATFEATLTDDGGTANGGVDTFGPIAFTITVNAVNDAPIFVIAADPPPVLEDAGAQTVANFATNIAPGPVTATDETGQTLTFILTITGTTDGLTFTSAPAINATNGTLTYTAAANSFGTATVQAVLQDNGGTANGGVNTSAPQTFVITVTGINDPPFFAIPADPPTVNEDAGPQTVLNFATNISAGPNEASQTLTFNISPVSFTGSIAFTSDPAIAANGTLTYTTAPDTNGTATFEATLTDDGGTANGGVDTFGPIAFTITVNAVNDAPILTAANPPSVLEDSGAQLVAAWASFSPGPLTATDEAGQGVLAYNVSNISNLAMFSVAPSVALNGDLTYTPAPDAFGTVTFDVTVQDDGGTANGGVDTSATQTFTITIEPVNDVPSYTGGPDVVSGRNAGAQTFPAWATNISAGPPNESDQALFFSVIIYHTIGALTFDSAPAIDPNSGNLTYTSAFNAAGTAYVAVFLSDSGGTANGGIQTTPIPHLFSITVTEPNAYMIVENPTANVSGMPNSFNVSGWALDAAAGVGNGPGIDIVRVYQGAVCGGILLGEAAPNIPRPEINAIFGLDSSYDNIGFSVPLVGLGNGILTFTTCGRSVIDGSYPVTDTRTVTIGNVVGALMSVEAPTPNAAVALSFSISGWAIDPNAGIGNGTGVDLVRVFEGNACTGTVIADATLGIARPDVRAYYGLDASYENSGFIATVNTPDPGIKTYTVCARSAISGLFSISSTRTLYASGWILPNAPLPLEDFTRNSLTPLDGLQPLEGDINDPAPSPDFDDQAPIGDLN